MTYLVEHKYKVLINIRFGQRDLWTNLNIISHFPSIHPEVGIPPVLHYNVKHLNYLNTRFMLMFL